MLMSRALNEPNTEPKYFTQIFEVLTNFFCSLLILTYPSGVLILMSMTRNIATYVFTSLTTAFL